MANKKYSDFATAAYDPAKILLQADPVTGALTKLLNSSFNLLKTATRILTDAEFKALKTTPIEIVPAGGANTVHVLISSLWIFNLSAGGYNAPDANNYDLQIGYGNNVVDASQTFNAHVGTPADSAIVMPVPGDFQGQFFMQKSQVNNKNLSICSDAPNNLTGGNAANTVQVTVFYTTVNV